MSSFSLIDYVVMMMQISQNTKRDALHHCPEDMGSQKMHTLLGIAAVALSSNKMRGPRSSMVSGDHSDVSLQ